LLYFTSEYLSNLQRPDARELDLVESWILDLITNRTFSFKESNKSVLATEYFLKEPFST
jgi:hypothetical protein